MSDNQLSRRKVLGALATTGGAGALVGTGTGALFTDEETFTNNGIRASTSISGTVDLEVVSETVELESGTGVQYDITLPDGINNNPAYIWLATSCPTPLDLGLATKIAIRVTCNGETTTIASGLASHVLNDLRSGVPLCSGGDDACLQVGETWTLTIVVTDTTSYSGSDETLEFDIELSGTQCRYNADNENPFDGPLTGGTCPQDISYVAFCAEGSKTAPEVTITDISGGYPPTSVDWRITNGVPVDYVIVRTGERGPNEPYTVYDYSPDGVTSGTRTAAVGDRFAAFVGTAKEAGLTTGEANSNPCQLAKNVVGDGTAFEGTSTKLEADPGDLRP